MDDYQAVQLLSFPNHDVLCIRFSTTKIVARMAFKYFSFALPLILLCKFTTSGDSQGHTQGLVSTFFSLFLGAAAPISKTTRISLKIIWAISCLFSPSPCWCYFARKI